MAMESQDEPESVYIQDVAVRTAARGRGVARTLLGAVEQAARQRGCGRMWLTTKPGNMATSVWPRLGFAAAPGDFEEEGVPVHRDLKGPGKDRVVFEKVLD